MGAFVFMLIWLPLMLVAPIYAEWKVKKEEGSADCYQQSTKPKHY